MEKLSLLDLMNRFSTEAACRAWFEAARWPDGAACPRCASTAVRRVRTRVAQFSCGNCRYRFSVTSGTPLHGTHLPLRTWLLALYLVATSSRGVSARRLAAWLGIGYRSAWHLGHRIRTLLAQDAGLGQRLAGIVEADETYIGGKPRRRNNGPRLKRGAISTRGNGKPCAFVAVERGGRVRMDVVANHSAAELGSRLLRWASQGAVLATDELPAYRRVGRYFRAHLRVHHGSGEFARTCRRTGLRAHNNTAESVNAGLKAAIRGVYHCISPRHLHRYVAETEYRWNQRSRDAAERLRGLGALCGPPLPFVECVA